MLSNLYGTGSVTSVALTANVFGVVNLSVESTVSVSVNVSRRYESIVVVLLNSSLIYESNVKLNDCVSRR